MYICMRLNLKNKTLMNNHKTYLAFNVDAVRDSKKENLHTLNLLGDWQKRYPNRFNFVNIDYINFIATHDDLVETTVKSDFFARMEKADNLMLVVTKETDADNVWLNWQISRAVNRYHLPVIVAFKGESVVTDDTLKEYWDHIPQKIKKYIGRNSARMCYIPLTETKVEKALGYFSVHSQTYPCDSTTIY